MARPQVVLSAYTGYLLCDVAEMQGYISEVLGREVFTHDMASEAFWPALRDALRQRGEFERALHALDAAFPATGSAAGADMVAPSDLGSGHGGSR